jgi:hypothetical protein
MGMYPDLIDLNRVLDKLSGVPRPDSDSTWEPTVLAYHFLFEMYGACKNHGRHGLIQAVELKTLAESFANKPIPEIAFMAGLLFSGYTTRPFVINPKNFESLQVKFPPIDRIEQFRERWIKAQPGWEQEVTDERSELAKRRW